MTGEERRIAERRTMALRGPGAGGFTPPQSLAAANPCLNCGTNIQLTYCPECGQAEIDSDPTLREFLHELAEEFLHWDGKLLRTFRLLVTRPGELTCEYLAGKRVRYISPLRLYLTCSVLFFFVGALLPQPTIVLTSRALDTARDGTVIVRQIDTTTTIAAFDRLAKSGHWVGRVWGVHFARALRNREALGHAIWAAVPKTMFVLVPMFAAMVGLVFRHTRRRYPQHLAFALHLHAFLFLALTVMAFRRLVTAVPVHVVLQVLCLGAVVIYMVKATHRVHGGSMGGAVARSALITGAYITAFVLAMVGTVSLVVLFQF